MKEKEIKKAIEKILGKMKIKAKVIVGKDTDNLAYNIETEDAGLLIGPKGESLAAFQHITQVICNKGIRSSEEISRFYLDVNSYKQKKSLELKEVIKYLAQKVLDSGRSEELEPMNAYERRLVHVELADHTELMTESIGDGLQRRVIIQLKNK